MEKRQVVNYAFFKALPEWRRLERDERERGKAEFAATIAEYSHKMAIRAYSTIGTRADTDFMLWRVCDNLEILREMTTSLLATKFAKYLTMPYSFLAMTKTSIYVGEHLHLGQEGSRLTVIPGKAKYLFVYPFVKTREWYLLPKATRQGMMNEHIAIGHRYPSVKINTAYSFGLDDQEFVVAFETDAPEDFLDLVMELREAETSRYTLRDTPIFSCMAMDVREMLDALG